MNHSEWITDPSMVSPDMLGKPCLIPDGPTYVVGLLVGIADPNRNPVPCGHMTLGSHAPFLIELCFRPDKGTEHGVLMFHKGTGLTTSEGSNRWKNLQEQGGHLWKETFARSTHVPLWVAKRIMFFEDGELEKILHYAYQADV